MAHLNPFTSSKYLGDMVKNKILFLIFGIIGIVLIIGSLYFAISYLSYIGKVLLDFFSANNVQAISECGVVIPEEFTEIRNQLPATILPAIYLGIPLALILIAGAMFVSGYFFGKHKVEMEIDAHLKREEHIEEEVTKRVGGKKPEPHGTKKPTQKKTKKPEEED